MVQRVSAAKKPREDDDSKPVLQPDKHSHDSGNTVTIACKLPNGLRLQLWKMVKVFEPGLGGGRTVDKAEKEGESIVVHGPVHPFGIFPEYQVLCGFALTPGIDKRFWEKWVEQNSDSQALQSGLITAWPSVSDAQSYAREHEKMKSGFEPIDPENPPKGLINNPNIKIGRYNPKDGNG